MTGSHTGVTAKIIGGVLGGTSVVGGIGADGGTIAPGVGGPGRLSVVGEVDARIGPTLAIDINGLTPAVSYDQLAVNGTVGIRDVQLAIVSAPGFTPPPTAEFPIVGNDGAGSRDRHVRRTARARGLEIRGTRLPHLVRRRRLS